MISPPQAPAQAAPPAAGAAPTASQPTASQPTASQVAPSPVPSRTWTVACDEPRQDGQQRECRISAAAVLQPQNQRLLGVILLRQPETRSLALVFQVAHGAALPAGLSWQIDDGDLQRLAFQNSDPEGVYAGIPVADDLLAALRRGAALRVGFVAAARREALTVTLPLAQFGEAAAEFLAAERHPPAP